MNSWRFGRDNFQQAVQISQRVDAKNIDWTNFKYMIFDDPTHRGTYQERYNHLGNTNVKKRKKKRRENEEKRKTKKEQERIITDSPFNSEQAQQQTMGVLKIST